MQHRLVHGRMFVLCGHHFRRSLVQKVNLVSGGALGRVLCSASVLRFRAPLALLEVKVRAETTKGGYFL